MVRLQLGKNYFSFYKILLEACVFLALTTQTQQVNFVDITQKQKYHKAIGNAHLFSSNPGVSDLKHGLVKLACINPPVAACH